MESTQRSADERIHNTLRVLSETTKDFWVPYEVKVLENPTPLEFMREAVMSYQPVIIRGHMFDWEALEYWSLDFLLNELEDTEVEVNVTADGFGDCVRTVVRGVGDEGFVQPLAALDHGNEEGVEVSRDEGLVHAKASQHFVYPLELQMKFSTFYYMMSRPSALHAVPYLSEQNDNLRKKFPSLMSQVPASLSLANEALGLTEPEAVNLWIGDERSVSSVHKDFFENFYCVLRGEKTFTLLPPTDAVFMRQRTYPTLRYAATASAERSLKERNAIFKSDLTLSVQGCPASELSWIALDPAVIARPGIEGRDDSEEEEGCRGTHQEEEDDEEDEEDEGDGVTGRLQKSREMVEDESLFALASPISCVVREGEILYLPAMWYHRVSQTCLSIAVNYWYEQKFDFRYAMFQTMKELGERNNSDS